MSPANGLNRVRAKHRRQWRMVRDYAWPAEWLLIVLVLPPATWLLAGINYGLCWLLDISDEELETYRKD